MNQPMSPIEAAEKVAPHYPQSSILVEPKFWFHRQADGSFRRALTYRIAVVPGKAPSRCDSGEGASLAEAVERLLGPLIPPTEFEDGNKAQVVEDELEQARRLPGGE